MLRRALGQRIGAHGPGSPPIVCLGLAAACAAAVGVTLQLVVPPGPPWLLAVETLIPFGVLYLAVAALLGQGMDLRRSS